MAAKDDYIPSNDQASLYLPELIRWFRNFLKAAHELSEVLEIAPGELDALVEAKDRYWGALFPHRHACLVNRNEINAEDLRREFFQAVRFLVTRLKTHPAMTETHYRALRLERPECRHICNGSENRESANPINVQ